MVSGTKGRGFKSRIARQILQNNLKMKKTLILLIIVSFVFGLLSDYLLKYKFEKKEKQLFKILLIQEKEEQKAEADSYTISLLKQLREKIDSWLKSINERIEKEDITRFEVRFLEILRSILEWVRGKIDSKLESLKEKGPRKRQDIFRETKNSNQFSQNKV